MANSSCGRQPLDALPSSCLDDPTDSGGDEPAPASGRADSTGPVGGGATEEVLEGWPALDDPIVAALASGCLRPSGLDAAGLSTFAPGEVLASRYVVERLLGRGGMGEVYVVIDRVLEQRVAIKTVLSTLADDSHAVRRLFREVSLARRIRHPNVCRVHDIGVHDDDPRDIVHFMIMDFIEGPSLKAWLRAHCPSLGRALSVARQILLGLASMHAARMLHGDLKSDNVMLAGADESHAVLVDFGLSQRLDGSQRARSSVKSGSVGYMAPEQSEGKELSPRSDIFSFGVVLYELLTGCLPFQPREPWARSCAASWTTVAPSALRPDIPPALDDVVLRCLRYAPEGRFADASSVLVALDDGPL